MPLAGVRTMKATEFWEFWVRYKADNKVNMIGGCSSEEAFNDCVAAFKASQGLK